MKQPLVQAIVEEVFPFGVFVRLENGKRAYIRRRNLTLSGDTDPRKVVSKGKCIQAVVIEAESLKHTAELSLRAALPDPWQEFCRQYQVGDVVKAKVKNVLPKYIFVEVAPGVDGRISLNELATWEVKRPDEVVWIGDLIEAVIIRLDASTKKFRLSIRQRLEQFSRVDAVAERLRQVDDQASDSELDDQEVLDVMTGIFTPICLDGLILVAEDDDDVRESLIEWLANLGCTASGVRSVQEALRACLEQNYRLVMVDLDLLDGNGIDLIRQLKRQGISVPIVVTSGAEEIKSHYAEFQELKVKAVFTKPLDLDEVYLFLRHLSEGETPVLQVNTDTTAIESFVKSFQDLTETMRSPAPLLQRFHQGLEQIVRDTNAESGMIFHMNMASGLISMRTHKGVIPIDDTAVLGLVDSPVKDVIIDKEIVWENQIAQEHAGRFRKLLRLIPFQSCIGVPIQAASKCEHALFLFHRQPDLFSKYRLRDTLGMATLLGVAIESQILEERAQNLGRVLLSGQLAAAFTHEVNNRASSFDLQLQNLRTHFDRFLEVLPDKYAVDDIHQIRIALEKVINTGGDLKQIIAGFRKIIEVRGDNDTVNINLVIEQAKERVLPLANKAKAEIEFVAQPGLPITKGSTLGLYQVFLNLMLNAIQQMENKPDSYRKLRVSVRYTENEPERPLQIRFADSGPGIHQQLIEQIFTLGFTTRPDGSGLGLYIARSMVESYGGRITIEENLVPAGVTFLVALPIAG